MIYVEEISDTQTQNADNSTSSKTKKSVMQEEVSSFWLELLFAQSYTPGVLLASDVLKLSLFSWQQGSLYWSDEVTNPIRDLQAVWE